MKLTTARRSAIAQDLIADMDAGTTNPNAVLEIYAGSIPAQMGQAISDTLLAELDLDTPAATEADGTITFNVITTDPSANDAGDAGWARIIDRDGGEAQYYTVGATGSGADIELNTVSLTQGGPVAITSGTIVVGGL